MSDIFLAYQRNDRGKAEQVAGVLERAGWSVFWDPVIQIGEVFDVVIERELENAKCVVVLWSREAVRSNWVRNEAGYALDRRKLVPARIEEVEPPLRFRDYQTADLVGWGGTRRHREFERLANAIAALAGFPKDSPGYREALRERARRDLMAEAKQHGFRQSSKAQGVYYHERDPDVRLVFLKTMVRVETRSKGKWSRRDVYDVVRDADRFFSSLKESDRSAPSKVGGPTQPNPTPAISAPM